MDGDPLHGRIIPPRRAATQASANFAEQLDGKSDSESPRRRAERTGVLIKYGGRRKRKRSSKVDSTTHPLSGVQKTPPISLSAQPATTSRPRPRPSFNVKKRPSTPPKPQSAIEDDSDLTPISSAISSPSRGSPQQRPQQRSPRRTDASQPIPGSSGSPTRRPRQPGEEGWDILALGAYVWVSLDKHARVFEPDDNQNPPDDSMDWLWWPGKIKSSHPTDVPLDVHIFGSTSFGAKTIEIFKPCVHNIVSLEDSLQRARFDSPTFANVSASNENLQGSPRKKRKRNREDMEEWWHMAVAEMVKEREEEEGSDVMPEVGTLGFVKFASSAPFGGSSPMKSGNGSPKKRGRGKRNVDSGDDLGTDSSWNVEANRWTPPLADDTLEIPGEVVLAREGVRSTIYWPAKILTYIPPTRRTQEGKYKVEFLDTTIGNIPRTFFYTADEDEFATCTLGKWESEYREIVNDDDFGEVDKINIYRNRSPSPLPSDPPPLPTDFIALDIRHQFVYTKPVMKAILMSQYGPAKKRHDLFIGGGQGKKSVVDEAGLRGRMDPKDVGELETCLSEWCLRDERRAKIIADETEKSGMDESNESVVVEGGTWEGKWHRGDHDMPATDTGQRLSPSSSLTDVVTPSSPAELPPDSMYIPVESDHSGLPDSSEAITGHDLSHGPVISAAETIQAITTPGIIGVDSHGGSERSRQQGCEAYEALAGVEKVDYCLNVLLPEAILQILLWRYGHRTSVDLLPDEAEQALHEKGAELLKETDWVYDVIRLRTSKARRLEKTAQKPEADIRTGTGRSRRNVGKPNYQE